MKISLLSPYIIVMSLLVAASNYLVQFPINDYVSWGSLTFPLTFLLADLTIRRFDQAHARVNCMFGFAIGVIISYILADASISIASGAAFLIGQLLDISIFGRISRKIWWKGPIISGYAAAFVDNLLF